VKEKTLRLGGRSLFIQLKYNKLTQALPPS
jgi:hypothetical protein